MTTYQFSDETPNLVGVTIMCKNEEKRILVTLESVKKIASCLIIYDTGSEDKTKEIIIEFCKENKINLHMLTGQFENFSKSRNKLLEYAETIDVEFLLLLDVNDELKGGDDSFINLLTSERKTDNNGYQLKQNWKHGVTYDEYYNTRLIKNKCQWRYHGVVHEYIKSPIEVIKRIFDKIVLFQDRNQDDDKSAKRFFKDKELLLEEHQKNSKDSRTVFYLAQTCMCLQQYPEAYEYMKKRSELDDFMEEKYQAYYKLGEIGTILKHDWHSCMSWYLKSYEICQRAEPLVKIAEHYMEKKMWYLAYFFIQEACSLKFPSQCLLFVNKYVYDYYRFHLLGRIAYYYEKYKEGLHGCLMALKYDPNSEIDKHNMKFYVDKNIN
jgi:hypothetical protein